MSLRGKTFVTLQWRAVAAEYILKATKATATTERRCDSRAHALCLQDEAWVVDGEGVADLSVVK